MTDQNPNPTTPEQSATELLPETQTEVTNVAAETPKSETKVSTIERNADDAKKIRHKAVVVMEICILVAVSSFLINFLLIYFTNNQVTLYQTNQQQIAASEYNSSDRANTVAYLENQRQNTELILSTFPSIEDDFVDFIQTIELLGQESANNSRLELNSHVAGNGGQSYFPFVISMTTDVVNFAEFLKRLEKLPYMVEVRSIESNIVDGSSQIYNFKLTSRIYVSNQFR